MSQLILIAEDDQFLLAAYKHQLEPEGYQLEIAKDGEEALHKLSTISPQLIILDLVMPKKSGMEVLRKIRTDEKTKGIPVIVATNISNSADKDECEKLGAVTYTIKTDVSMQQLSALVKKTLESK